MRLIHTADWHLGRLFHNVHLTRDQEHVLEQLVALAEEVEPAAVIVAGDLYDRAVPPTEAVDLLDHVLTELVDRLGVPVIAIAGNHDSAVRVGFGSALLRERGLHLVGELPQAASPIILHDEHGPVRITALPFADPAEARHEYGDDAIHDQQAVMAAGVRRALAATMPHERHVLVGHAFVAGGLESESERPLSVGRRPAGRPPPSSTASTTSPSATCTARRPAARRRSGTRAPCSSTRSPSTRISSRSAWSTSGRAAAPRAMPAASGRAAVAVETVALTPRRDVRRIEGTLADLLERGAADPRRDDYVLASLTDTGALFDPIGRLRAAYPNALAIERPVYERAGADGQARPRPGSVSDVDLFGAFFQYVTDEELGGARRDTLAAVVDGLERRRREAAP